MLVRLQLVLFLNRFEIDQPPDQFVVRPVDRLVLHDQRLVHLNDYQRLLEDNDRHRQTH